MKKSRFLNVSPRAYIRQKDSQNTLSPIDRTGYQNELAQNFEPFNDSNKILFFQTGSTVLAPYMVPESTAQTSGFLTGNLKLKASILDRNAYLEKKITNSGLVSAYKESSNPIIFSNSESLDEGFPEEIYAGFSSPESDKSAIIFDITCDKKVEVYRLNQKESERDAAGPLKSKPGSGFLYYNVKSSEWEDVGIVDPIYLTDISYDPVLGIKDDSAAVTGRYSIGSKSSQYMCQFTSSPYSIITEKPLYDPRDVAALKARGYDKIGEPTSYFEAPYAPRYHANQDRTFKLSNYITKPFVVDRISVMMPVQAYRTQVPHTGSGNVIDKGYGRDIDNYVFFAYVQNRTSTVVDSRQDASSSIRYLIGKQSFCFYNSPTLDEVETGLQPIHSFGHSVSFNMDNNIASIAGKSVEDTRNLNVNMSFRPLTFSSAFGTTSRIAASGEITTVGKITSSLFVQHFWRGGQYGSASQGEIGRIDGTYDYNVRSGNMPPIQENVVATASPRSLLSSFGISPYNMISSGSGIGEIGKEPLTITVGSFSRETPVVLFPEDEIVFGIESGVNPIMLSSGKSYDGTDNDVLEVTGSRLSVLPGNASVIFYGSLVSNNRELLPELNQHLGSDAIHEDIHDQGPTDQFDIFSPKILSGSYIDNIFLGGLKTRRRVASAVRGEGWITGSLQRNIRLLDNQQIYYDSLSPSVLIISGGIANTTDALVTTAEKNSNVKEAQVLKIIDDSSNGFAFDNNRTGDVLLKRSFTYENSTISDKRIKNFELRLYSTISTLLTTAIGSKARTLLFYNGKNPRYESVDISNYSGASSLRYGLVSTEIVGPSNVFRRDRFGQMRDMLEQSRDSKILRSTKGKDALGSSVVIATFVSASSDITTDGIYTQCSNLSIECTSSIPYTDGVVRNRGNNVPSFKATFGPNNLIFGVTGSFGMQ